MLKGIFPALGLAIAVALAGGPAFAGAGDPVKGEKVFKKCKACHSAKPGKHKVGPSLAGVFGRKAGTAEGYKRYKGLKGADYTWDEALLDEYLADPKKFVKKRGAKGTLMRFKLKTAAQRADVIAYLKTLK
ncbi:MAG: cytochrome c family protein [Rhodospirillales bacterium]